jgi:ESCRT-I complex subunit TSG101
MPSAQIDKIITDLLSSCQYKYKDLSKRDISQALDYFKELNPKQDKYVYPNGQVKDLLTLSGTVPVNFKGVRYNIPVQIYLSDLHPYTPPIAYVRPTPDMSINVSETVDSNGRVMLPFLTEWNYPHSDLYMLLNFMTIRFSEHTPLFAKSNASNGRNINPSNSSSNFANNPLPYPTDSRPPYPMPNTYTSSMPSYPSANSSYNYDQAATAQNNLPPYSSATSGVYPPASNNPYYPMNNTPQIKSASSSSMGGQARISSQPVQNNNTGYQDDTIKPEYYRMSLISAIQDKVRIKYNENVEAKMAEIDSLKRVNDDLKRSQSYLDNLISDATNEMSSIERLTEQLKIKSVEITESLNRIQHRDKANIEDAIVTPMPLYRQILQLYAEELSIQDLIYYLSEGLSRNSISLENFLKQIRLLTRKQFMLRATMQKAREKAGLPL